jgi:hypothetical protein
MKSKIPDDQKWMLIGLLVMAGFFSLPLVVETFKFQQGKDNFSISKVWYPGIAIYGIVYVLDKKIKDNMLRKKEGREAWFLPEINSLAQFLVCIIVGWFTLKGILLLWDNNWPWAVGIIALFAFVGMHLYRKYVSAI